MRLQYNALKLRQMLVALSAIIVHSSTVLVVNFPQ